LVAISAGPLKEKEGCPFLFYSCEEEIERRIEIFKLLKYILLFHCTFDCTFDCTFGGHIGRPIERKRRLSISILLLRNRNREKN
jgi:hypothetical protein